MAKFPRKCGDGEGGGAEVGRCSRREFSGLWSIRDLKIVMESKLMVAVSASELKHLKSSTMAPRRNIFHFASSKPTTCGFVAQPCVAAVKCDAARPARSHRDQM